MTWIWYSTLVGWYLSLPKGSRLWICRQACRQEAPGWWDWKVSATQCWNRATIGIDFGLNVLPGMVWKPFWTHSQILGMPLQCWARSPWRWHSFPLSWRQTQVCLFDQMYSSLGWSEPQCGGVSSQHRGWCLRWSVSVQYIKMKLIYLQMFRNCKLTLSSRDENSSTFDDRFWITVCNFDHWWNRQHNVNII